MKNLNNIKRLFFIFSIVTIGLSMLNACKKDDRTIQVSGTVTDATGNKVEGVTVNLQGTILQGGAYSSSFSDIASAKTDANGFYEINTDWQTVGKYKITLFKYNYFESSQEYIADDISKGSKVTKNLIINPVAWLKMVVNNTDPYDDSDKITFKYDSEGTPLCYDCCNNNPTLGEGMIYSNTSKCKLPGNKNAKISWTVLKNGEIKTFSENIFCPAFDTTAFNINY